MSRKSQWLKEPTTEAEIVAYIEKNLPGLFHGCDVRITTENFPPEHGVVDPDTRTFRFD